MSNPDNVPPEATEPAGTTSSDQPKGWRAFLPIHPAAELFPLMSEAELKELAADIDKHDLKELVCLYDDPELGVCVLDGRNRFDALELLKWEAGGRAHEPPSEERRLPTGLYQWVERKVDPYAYVLSKNVHRRHLTSDQKRDLIAVLAAKPELSNRRIADQLKVDPKTVGAVRSEKEGRGEIPHVAKRIDQKGRKQPAQRRARTPKAAAPKVKKEPVTSYDLAKLREAMAEVEVQAVAGNDTRLKEALRWLQREAGLALEAECVIAIPAVLQ